MNYQEIFDIIAARDFSKWQQIVTSDVIARLPLQDYQNLCNECVDRDWGQGVGHLKQKTEGTSHDWYWLAPDATQSPGNAFFRAIQHARVQCVRELVHGMPVNTLKHAILLGSSNTERPLKMTQNRIRSLSYIAKELQNHPAEELEKLSKTTIFLRSVLGNNHLGVAQSFHDVWDKGLVWETMWTQLKNQYIKEDGSLLMKGGACVWVEGLEVLWQVTENHDEIPKAVRKGLMEVASHPQNASHFPYIHSQLSKNEILNAIDGTTNTQRNRKKM